VCFEDSTDYNFGTLNPISKQKFIQFECKVKTLSGIPRIIQVQSTKSKSKYRSITEDEQMAYQLARYFKSRGPQSKLTKSDASAYALNKIAAYYCEKGRYEEAKMYAQAALSTSSRNSCLVGIAKAICFHSSAAMQPNIVLGPGSDTLSLYQSAINSMQWHCGPGHPLIMAAHDRLASLYIKAKNFEHALDIHDISLDIAEATLGKNHSTTAGYLTKVRKYN
jgi:tetratricopeptide (TPR) repeat protein